MLELNLIWLERIIFGLMTIFGLLLIGAINVFNPFSLTVIGVTLVLFVVLQKTTLAEQLVTNDTQQVQLLRVALISCGHILNWVFLFFSKRTLPTSEMTQSIEKAGFPFITFYYPQPPMGGDIPPSEMWLPFFLNLFFWLAVSYALFHHLKRTTLFQNNQFAKLIIALGLILTLIGFGYTAHKFD